MARISAIYEANGVELGSYEVWGRQSSLFGHRTTLDLRGKAVIVPPHMTREIARIHHRETVALTGWALHGTRDAHHGLPLSDHAGYGELLELADRCPAKVIYVTPWPNRFADDLRRRASARRI